MAFEGINRQPAPRWASANPRRPTAEEWREFVEREHEYREPIWLMSPAMLKRFEAWLSHGKR